MLRRLDRTEAMTHLDRMYAAARALCGDPHLAEDLVHDTYAAVLARPRWLAGSDELGYLLRALQNRWTDHLRARGRRPAMAPLEDMHELIPSDAPEPDRIVAGSHVLEAVHDLPSPYRETIVAVDVLGMSYAEAGAALRVPVGTIMSRLHRGRARVADRLTGPPAATPASPSALVGH